MPHWKKKNPTHCSSETEQQQTDKQTDKERVVSMNVSWHNFPIIEQQTEIIQTIQQSFHKYYYLCV